jgi:hypothetical protein
MGSAMTIGSSILSVRPVLRLCLSSDHNFCVYYFLLLFPSRESIKRVDRVSSELLHTFWGL